AGFHHPAARHFQLAHQFHADGAAGGSQMDPLQERAPDQTIIAIDIADADAEQQPRAEVVGLADPDAVRRIATFQLVAVHQAGIGAHQFQQARQFADIVLAVAIGIEDEFLGGRLEPAAQRAAIAAILWMRDHAQAGTIQAAQSFQHGGRVIATAVVDHDDFVIRYVGCEGRERLGQQAGQRRRIVVCRKEDAQRWEIPRSRDHNIFSPISTSDCPTGKLCPAPSHAASMASGTYSSRSSQGATRCTPLSAGLRNSGSHRRNLSSAIGINRELEYVQRKTRMPAPANRPIRRRRVKRWRSWANSPWRLRSMSSAEVRTTTRPPRRATRASSRAARCSSPRGRWASTSTDITKSNAP